MELGGGGGIAKVQQLLWLSVVLNELCFSTSERFSALQASLSSAYFPMFSF